MQRDANGYLSDTVLKDWGKKLLPGLDYTISLFFNAHHVILWRVLALALHPFIQITTKVESTSNRLPIAPSIIYALHVHNVHDVIKEELAGDIQSKSINGQCSWNSAYQMKMSAPSGKTQKNFRKS